MSEDLLNELKAISSIYGQKTIVQSEPASDVYILSIPNCGVSLRLCFTSRYPEQPPEILGTEGTSDTARKGYGAQVLTEARDILGRTFTPGSVCLFDLLQGLEDCLQSEHDDREDAQIVNAPRENRENAKTEEISTEPWCPSPSFHPPEWTPSETVTSKKSTFVARACPVSSAGQARAALDDLIANDKRVAKATHNINAYRIRLEPSSNLNNGSNELIYQDCDDDGETAAGGRLLHLLQVMDVWNVFVVVSRWYGGIQLGPDRFRIISQVAREAVVRGGWIKGSGQEPQRNRNVAEQCSH